MLQIKYNCRVYPHKINGSVMIRVRWNRKKSNIEFSTGKFVELAKWDESKQRAKTNTTHTVGNHVDVARSINRCIDRFLDIIDEEFKKYEVLCIIPDPKDLKSSVQDRIAQERDSSMGKPEVQISAVNDAKLTDVLKEFLKQRPQEISWSEHTAPKYVQSVNHANACQPNITIGGIDKTFINRLRQWYIRNGYHNATSSKQMRCLKALLRWAKANGYPVCEEALNYTPKIIVPQKRVIYLQYEELMAFYSFDYPAEKKYLKRARDMFCFMAFTSLRYSDMSALKKTDVVGDFIQIYTEKTDQLLSIPLLPEAKEILVRYKDTEGIYAFPAPSNQKLNDYIKEAAEMAGLDRIITETFYVGNVKHEEVHKLYETLSCHDARRTFVCCSLRLGIPAQVVMSCTGHSDYESMKPYIEVADNTTAMEMQRWGRQKYRGEILSMLDGATEDQLKAIIEILAQRKE